MRRLARQYLAISGGDYRISVQGMLAEVALTMRDGDVARQAIDALSTAATTTSSRSTQLGLAMYRWQLARLLGSGIVEATAGHRCLDGDAR